MLNFYSFLYPQTLTFLWKGKSLRVEERVDSKKNAFFKEHARSLGRVPGYEIFPFHVP
jgi:hypothetical protein